MTILNTITLTKAAPWVIYSAIACVVCIVLGFALSFILCGRSVVCDKIAGFCAVIAVISFFAAFVLAALSDTEKFTVPNGKYHYEVIFDEDVTFNEINEKYIIIEQRGEIFVVEEKE